MASASTDPLERLEALLDLEDRRARSRRMLVIVNPYASMVSPRLRNLVVDALRNTFDLHAVDTEAPGHATDLGRAAARDGYDVVVAFGGDGTVNETANGLVGSPTALCCLPGGRANVYCRMLGIPTDLVDATEHLLGLADAWRPRRVDVGRVNERCFLFSAGVGLDASVVERVDAHPRAKVRLGEWYYAAVALYTFVRRYLVSPPRLRVRVGAETVDGVTAIVQNAAPYTFFGRRPVDMGEGASLRSGDLAGVVLRRARPLDGASVAWRALSRRARIVRHPRVHPFSGVRGLEIRSRDERPLPLQVDGDYIGAVHQACFAVAPRSLVVVA